MADQYQYGCLARPKSQQDMSHPTSSGVASSQKGQDQHQNAPYHYQESMKYINEFYEKYNGSQYQAEGSSMAEEQEEGEGQ